MTTCYHPPDSYPTGGLLDPEIILAIPLNCYVQPGQNSEAWVWTFLRVCLYTVVGFDEADKIVQDIQLSRPDFTNGKNP